MPPPRAAITERQFVEVLAAPAVSAEAARVLAGKPNVRVLVLGRARAPRPARASNCAASPAACSVSRAILPTSTEATSRRRRAASPRAAELADLRFAWRVCKFVKSNAIVFARGGATVGVGAGQMSRVYSTRVAAMKAADEKLSTSPAR